MSPSRRQLVGAIGTAVALSGCSMVESGTGSDTDQSVSDAIAAQLLGPEAVTRLFEGSDVVRVGEVTESGDSVTLPLELSDAAATSVTEQFRATNVSENASEFEIQLLDDGETFRQFGVTGDLASEVESDDWDGKFVMGLQDRATAEEVRSRLLADGQGTP